MKKIISIFACLLFLSACEAAPKEYRQTDFVMGTIATQHLWAPDAQEIAKIGKAVMDDYQNRLSMFLKGSDIAKINESAGKQAVHVDEKTYQFLQDALALAKQESNFFALTMGPATKAWGVGTEHPRVPSEEEIAEIIGLIDDSDIVLQSPNQVTLKRENQAVDTGAIAKGAALDAMAEAYRKAGVRSAVLDLGGNIMTIGKKPTGEPFRIGFREPMQEGVAVASFLLEDKSVAVSGGYERFFEVDGKRYIHIFNPKTAKPVESDLLTVGVIREKGIEADFYSTVLYAGGISRTLEYMKQGGQVIALSKDGVLYVSKSLEDSFRWENGMERKYQLQWVETVQS